VSLPDPGPLLRLICGTFAELQAVAPLVALLWIALWLLLALALGGGALRAVSVFIAVVIGLTIMTLPSVLGALGAGGGCS
jgi:hypothetical protein